MIKDPALYLISEHLKNLNDSSMQIEEYDIKYNVLNSMVSSNGNKSINAKGLIRSYFSLKRDDYLEMGVEVNAWFLELIIKNIKVLPDMESFESNNDQDHKNKLFEIYKIFANPQIRFELVQILFLWNRYKEMDILSTIDQLFDSILHETNHSEDEHIQDMNFFEELINIVFDIVLYEEPEKTFIKGLDNNMQNNVQRINIPKSEKSELNYLIFERTKEIFL